MAKTLFDVDIIFKCIMATSMDGFHSFGGRVCCNILVAKECKSTNNTNTNPNHKKCITLNNNKAFQISHTPKILIVHNIPN